MAKARKRYRRGRRTKKRGFASWPLGKKIAAVLGGTFLLVLALGVGILASKLSKIETTTLDPEALNVSEEARERGTGYLNVALFGVDSREGDMEKDTRSDTIMIASLNLETLEVKIASVYRDTLLEQKDGSLNKANAAYSFGGPEDAVAMLNKNLDMNIEHYVTVDFDALIDVVDAVGGIDIDVQEEEVDYICAYAAEIMEVTGRQSAGVTEPGLQTLNGVQATAYARIRYTTGDDFRRTERQREVLTQVVQKLQSASMSQINKIIDSVFPNVSTNFTLAEILDYAKDAFDYKLGETVGFPYDKSTDTLSEIGSVVIPVTLEDNVRQLHEFFYGTAEGYSPSSTVSSISANIIAKAGDRAADTSEESQGVMEQPSENYYDSGTSNSGTGLSGTGNSGTGTGGWTGGGTGGTGGTGGSGSSGGSNTGDGTGTGGGTDPGTGTGGGTDPGTGTGGGTDPGIGDGTAPVG